ncbi:MAG: type VI secretion protein IcmF/TssM N-terminal domain-containing protein [Fuerstiella sp.]
MSSFFYKALEWTRLLFGMVPRSGFGSAKLFRVLHFCFMGLIAIILAIFTPEIRGAVDFLDKPFPGIPNWIERIWCGVAFVIVYCIIRIVLYLLELLGVEDDSEFPDIEDDWRDILIALDRERLPIDDVPLFLVNGFTPEQEQSSFESSSNIDWKVIAPPMTQKSAVIRAYASDEAIFLCCTGIGAANFQQGKVSSEPKSAAAVPYSSGAGVTGTLRAGSLDVAVDRARSATGTNPAGAPLKATPPPSTAPTATTPPAAAPSALGGFFGTIAPGGLKRAMETFASLRSSDVKGSGKKRLASLDDNEIMLGIRRMHFLCGLIKESRWPFCPINGMLQGIPFSWAEDQDYAKSLAPAVREDIIAVHENLQLQFPLVAVITELDDVAGMREFILRAERLQPGLRLSRAGSSFAAGAHVNDEHAGWLIQRAMHWFRGWVYSAFSQDINNRDNQKMFGMLCAINQRQETMVTLLREAMYKAVTPQPRLQGCYFCATGRGSTEQAFIRGVLDKLPESQGEVAWTPQLRKSQQRSGNLAWGFLVCAGLLAVATVILVLNLGGN